MATDVEGADFARLGLRLVALLFGALLLVLVVTGAWLAFEYRPMAEEPMRSAHRIASILSVPVGLVLAVFGVARQRASKAVAATVFFLVLVATGLLGVMLPWDHLGLTAVRVGADFSGVLDPFGDEVRFVVVRRRYVSLREYQAMVVAHLVVLPAVLLAAGGFLLRR